MVTQVIEEARSVDAVERVPPSAPHRAGRRRTRSRPHLGRAPRPVDPGRPHPTASSRTGRHPFRRTHLRRRARAAHAGGAPSWLRWRPPIASERAARRRAGRPRPAWPPRTGAESTTKPSISRVISHPMAAGSAPARSSSSIILAPSRSANRPPTGWHARPAAAPRNIRPGIRGSVTRRPWPRHAPRGPRAGAGSAGHRRRGQPCRR